ncbi:MAG: alpha/beta fold hydrolase [Nocardioidaceae bacterium]
MVMQAHRVDGSALTYELRGEGNPVLLIHGALGQVEIWAEVVEALAATHRVLAYDRRGHGRSPNATANRRRHAEDAAALVREVVGEPATVVGYSSGGSIALETALLHPELMRALVLIEPPWHWLRPPSAEFVGLLAKARYAYLRGRDREAAEMFLRWVFKRQSGGTAWDDTPPDLKELLLGNSGAFDIGARPHRYDQMLNDVSAKAVANCAVPVTFLLGDDSHPIFHRSHQSLTAALPTATTRRIPKATHLLPCEAPESVVVAVREADADAA